ncbi:hypothetical protein BLL52_4085 [Rhodoferax antarcticus ANT.BR]|uniref:Uncharacterized protein n=1 Tax=Rhodoferax antarcticus ANT.BR TaxID=1111071 RepID=A0A1Q8Y9F1_9BURK|nr:hypothetical protein BLL52_4085 [Rhodoferax antarcticus ANT.BR]
MLTKSKSPTKLKTPGNTGVLAKEFANEQLASAPGLQAWV